MDLNTTIKRLRTFYFLLLATVSLLIVTSFMRGGSDHVSGGYSWLLQNLLTLVNIAVIPLAFSLMSFKKVREDISRRSEAGLQAYYRMSMMRLNLLAVPAIIDLLSVRLRLDNTNAALAIMLSLTLLFFWPCQKLYRRDTAAQDDEQWPQ